VSAAVDRAPGREPDPAGEAFVAAPDGRATGTTFECGLCGTAFTHGGRVCGACPLNAGCDLVRCPNCGYQFPRSSRLADWGRRLWRRWTGAGARG